MKINKILTNPFVWAFFLGIGSLHIIKEWSLSRRTAPEPLVYVGDWSLIDQNGRSFGSKDLQGKIVIADFFFTSCPTICPRLTNAMKEVFERFKHKTSGIHFVSISVDPENDKPEVLKKFMKDNGLDEDAWHSLTGTKDVIYDVVTNKMRVHVGERTADQNYDIPHLGELALFDQNGDLRGLFKTENTELAALVRAANFLLEKR